MVRFASIACGNANFAVTSRGVVHSWAGSQAHGLGNAAWSVVFGLCLVDFIESGLDTLDNLDTG